MTKHALHIGPVRVDPPLVMAPMAGVTNLPFRRVVKEHGAGMTVTEMVSAMGLCQKGHRTERLLDTFPAERPFCVQIFGYRPEYLARAASICQEIGADVIDLNMGCPARKVVRHGSGSALLKDFDLVERIVKAVRRAVDAPLTVKTRTGWKPGQGEVLDLIPILADNGVDALTIHPHYGVDMFAGRADWSVIAEAVRRFPGPVIGNGDVRTPEDALRMIEETGCRGVMIGRGALGAPWIFRRTAALLDGRPDEPPSLAERGRAAILHAEALGDRVGRDRAVFMLRSVLMWYTKGLPESAAFRHSINQVRDYDLLMEMVRAYFESLDRGGERTMAL